MRAFQVWPKRVKKGGGQILTPEMIVVVSIPGYPASPFHSGAKELKAEYMNRYHCNLDKIVYNPGDFDFRILG